MKFLEHRIADRRVVRLIQKWLNAGVLEDGTRAWSETGTPQGGSASPLLANVYLHYVFDLWSIGGGGRRTAATSSSCGMRTTSSWAFNTVTMRTWASRTSAGRSGVDASRCVGRGCRHAASGESRTPASSARPRPGHRSVAARRHSRAPAVLRSPDELAGAVHLLRRSRASLAPGSLPAQSARRRHLGAHAAAPTALAACSAHRAPLPAPPLRPSYLRQEPSAGNPDAGICGGGAG